MFLAALSSYSMVSLLQEPDEKLPLTILNIHEKNAVYRIFLVCLYIGGQSIAPTTTSANAASASP